jgi:hypothetical protein
MTWTVITDKYTTWANQADESTSWSDSSDKSDVWANSSANDVYVAIEYVDSGYVEGDEQVWDRQADKDNAWQS